MSSRMNIQKAKADAQAKRLIFEESARIYYEADELAKDAIKLRLEKKKAMARAHRDFVAVKRFIK